VDKSKKRECKKFQILDMNGVQINLPEDEIYYPHQEALEWHEKEVFNQKNSSQLCCGVRNASEASFLLSPELALGFIPLIKFSI